MHEDKKEENHDNDLWNIKAKKLMLDWVDKFSCLYCVHLGFTIIIDVMMKLFKGRSNTDNTYYQT